MAALALSGDWAAEFLSGPDSASAPGLVSLGDAADADWTKEFIAEAAGSFSLLYFFFFFSFFLEYCPNFFQKFFSRSWTMGRGISGAVGGEAVAGRSGRQRERLVRIVAIGDTKR